MRASDVSMRCTSDSLLISSEKNATGTLCSIAACCAMLSMNAVFPIDGRAATMIEIRRLEARRQLVEIVEAARDAGDRLAAALQRFDALHRRPEQLLDAREAVARLLLADLEDLRLGFVEQLGRGARALERLGDDRRRDLDQPAEDRLLANDLRVVLDVRRRRHGVDEEADVVLAARRLELAAPLQLVGERQRIDDAAALGDRHHRAEDPAMPLGVEHRVVDVFDRAEHRVLVDQHRRQHRLLGVLRVWRTPVAVRITRQGWRYRVFDGRAGHLPRWGASNAGFRRSAAG